MDTRLEKLAKLLVNYSVEVQPGQWVLLRGEPPAEPLLKLLYREVLEAGGHPQVVLTPSWEHYLLLRHGNEAQLDFLSPTVLQLTERVDASISAWSVPNTKMLTNIPAAAQQRRSLANRPLSEAFFKRAAEGSLRWVGTLYPTEAFAQDAEMSLDEYEAFVYGAGLLDDPDPSARWREVSQRQQRLVDWLKGRDQVHIRGSDADLHLSIKDRIFINADGHYNFPDGEIFTGPVEHSVNGWVRFTYPAVLQGREVSGIEFTFEEGKVVRATAKKNQEALEGLLETDAGARFLGEFGIGTNPGIRTFTRNALFDEKIQGTFHLAIGASYPETGGLNVSAIHEDIVCDLNDGEIIVDGELFYRNGEFEIQ